MATGGARLHQDSDSAPASSTTQCPRQGGHLGAGRAAAQPGQAKGMLHCGGDPGDVSTVTHGHEQNQGNAGTKEIPSLAQIQFLLPEIGMDGSSHITFYSICAAWALISTN